MSDTIDTIVDDMLNEGHTGPADSLEWVQAKMKFYADRIEAAAKREAAIHAMTCEANERLREHLEIALEDDKRTVGNAAAMREALERCRALAETIWQSKGGEDVSAEIAELKDLISAALAKPPRNCDLPLVVDGPANNNADKAWYVFKRHNPDAYFDVPGLLRCIDWLLATATKQKEERRQR